MLDAEILDEARKTRDRLVELRHEVERTRTDYHHVIRRLHAAGGSMREIADNLGLSHQRVHQIVDDPGEWPVFTIEEECETPGLLERVKGRRRKGRPGPFGRFTERARGVVVLAQEEARALKHNYVGTEHILLGLLRLEDGVAPRALEELGITYDAVRAQVVRNVGEGKGGQAGRLPFTPRSKKLLELALREALALKHNYVGTEHVLLGLVRAEEGVGAKILAELGADADAVRAAVIGMLARPAE